MIKKDASITNERLLYLINNYPKEEKSKRPKSKLEFAKLLYDNFWKLLGFETKRNINKRYIYTSPENKDYRNDIDIVYKELCSDLKSENCNTSKANYIIAYCKYFKCSADYLLGFIDLPTHADTDINKETGLSKDAINCLHMLHTPLCPSCSDSSQDSRYDIIALNIILEDLYTNFKNEEEWKTFSSDSILNQIGQYMDSDSINFGIKTPVFAQNGKTEIFSQGEIAREMFRTRIFDSLRYLYEKHSLHISGKINENKEYFKRCFGDYVRSFYNKKN